MPALQEARAAEGFLNLLGEESARKALLACSAALNLDDDVARRAIALVAQSNGSTDRLLDRVKGLSCVWKQWDGTWYVAEDVRTSLVDHLGVAVSAEVRTRLHELLAEAADRRLLELVPDGQLFEYQTRACHLEAGYQQTQVTGREEAGAERLLTAWRQAKLEAKDATAEAVDHLASDLERQGRRLPDQVLFLRGMAARSRRDWRRAEAYFQAVWERRQPGEIQAIAAHLFANLTRDRSAAEQALQDSLNWHPEPFHQAQVWHSLGNLLAKDRNRSKDAEDAFRKSLEMLHDPRDQGQVWHSLGNLLAKDRNRSKDAEDAFRKSLEMLHDPQHQGQVWHSLGNLLAKDRNRSKDAEDTFRKSLEMLHDPQDQAQVWHSLGNLLAKDRSRSKDAEDAFRKSLEMLHDPQDQGQVYASWANALAREAKDNSAVLDQAAEFANKARELDPRNIHTRAIATKVLSEVFREKGDLRHELEALEELLELERKRYRHQDAQRTEHRIREIKGRL